MNQVWLALITGLTTGGISCFAVQGGLLATSTANQNQLGPRATVTWFLVSKFIIYTILGALLGLLGASVVISPKLQGFLQIMAGVVMLITVGRILDLHPFFRKFSITPPKFIYKLIRKESVKGELFSPIILGVFTVLIPCGVTQAMMLLAIASGSAFWGALIMGAFTLGTSPVFFGLGIASGKILQHPKLKYFAALVIFVLGISALNTGQILRGSPHTLQNYLAVLGVGREKDNVLGEAQVNSEGFQEAEIRVVSGGYKSQVKTLKAGVPTRITLTTKNTKGCARAFTIPEFNILKVLPETGTEIVEITPTKTGRLNFTCSMGMYSGYFEVI